jgi:hypothetical protein
MLLLPPRVITGSPEVLRCALISLNELGDLLLFRCRIGCDTLMNDCSGYLTIWISLDSND